MHSFSPRLSMCLCLSMVPWERLVSSEVESGGEELSVRKDRDQLGLFTIKIVEREHVLVISFVFVSSLYRLT